MHKPRIAFFGTPWIAKKCLEALIDLDIELICIVCQPDKQKDRKNNFVYSEVKIFAIERQIKLFQPNKISELYDELKLLELDLIITCAFGQFVPESVLNLPKFGCVNLHASLLPKLRGGAPIHWAIINQEKTTGISLMYMVKKMDAGNVIVQTSIDIDPKETYYTLLIKLANLAQSMIKQYTISLCQNNIASIPQDENLVSFGCNILSDDQLLDFNQSSKILDAKIRGLYSKPMAKLSYHNQLYKIHEAYISNIKSTTPPGTINYINKQGISISTTDFDLIITKIQPPNKNVMRINDMINGTHPFIVGEIVG